VTTGYLKIINPKNDLPLYIAGRNYCEITNSDGAINLPRLTLKMIKNQPETKSKNDIYHVSRYSFLA
jgi:hypothetical protein